MNVWNVRKLGAPPTFTYRAPRGEIDLNHLQSVVQDGVNFYQSQNLLAQETALLCRLTYKMKRKFCKSKDFQNFEKIKKNLLIYSKINITYQLEHFLSVIPNDYREDDLFLPTKNMLDFILVRLQGVGKVLCHVVDLCQLTAEYYECRVRLGHFWQMALFAIACTSRIYILSLNIIKFTCLLYVRLLPYSHKLKNTGVNWLPDDYELPKDLKEWLNVEWTKIEEAIEIPDKNFDLSFYNLADDSDDDVAVCDEYIEIKEEDDDEDLKIIEEPKIKLPTNIIASETNVTKLRGFSSDPFDMGEIIESDEEVPTRKKKNNDIIAFSTTENSSTNKGKKRKRKKKTAKEKSVICLDSSFESSKLENNEKLKKTKGRRKGPKKRKLLRSQQNIE